CAAKAGGQPRGSQANAEEETEREDDGDAQLHGSTFWRKRSDFGFTLRVRQRAELRPDSRCDGRRFAARLETCEIGAIAPRERPAQAHAGFYRRIVNDIDGALVVRRSL